jgi:hypothetical protein
MFPVEVKRRELASLIDAAFNHIIGEKMVGLDSTTGRALEDILLSFPCLYCGGRDLSHSDSCDRLFWRGEPTYERVLREYRSDTNEF